jgi:hypothetical protein
MKIQSAMQIYAAQRISWQSSIPSLQRGRIVVFLEAVVMGIRLAVHYHLPGAGIMHSGFAGRSL